MSDGGLAVALAECAATAPEGASPVGGRIDLELSHDAASSSVELASLLFGEHPTRVLVTVRSVDASWLTAAAEKAGVPAVQLGVTGGTTLSIHVDRPHPTAAAAETRAVVITSLVASIEELRAARESALVPVVGA